MQKARSLATLDHLWIKNCYFCREPFTPDAKFAFTNYGLGIGLQAIGADPERVQQLHQFFDTYQAGDEYDRAAITALTGCQSRVRNWTSRNSAPNASS